MNDSLMKSQPEQLAETSNMDSGDDNELAYCVELYVFKNGTYRVAKESKGQETAEHEATNTEMGEDGQDFDKLGDALQGILQIVKQNPAGEDAGSQLEAGYGQVA